MAILSSSGIARSIAFGVALLTAVLAMAACGQTEPVVTQVVVTATPLPTVAPSATPAPTYTPLPTYTPYPTLTSVPEPTWTPTLRVFMPTPTLSPSPTRPPIIAPPTVAPVPVVIPTPMPLPTLATPIPIPSPVAPVVLVSTPPATVVAAEEWESSGHWYKDTGWEAALASVVKETSPGLEVDIAVATLDANPSGEDDLFLSLACLDDAPIAYLSPYILEFKDAMDVYTFGIWDKEERAFVDDFPLLEVVKTDDESSIYISNRVVLNEIVGLLSQSAKGLPEFQSLTAGVWAQEDSDSVGFWSEFEAEGVEDAIEYLGCY